MGEEQDHPQLAAWLVSGDSSIREISEKASELILSSWRLKTNAVYNSAWRKWEEWCREKDVCSVAAILSGILEFLACQFEKGKQYRSLNVYRSALSSTHLPIKGFPVGQHLLVVRLLKGVFNVWPPQPKYSSTWDVAKILTYLRSLGRNKDLSLMHLTKKLVVLLALVLAHRSSDLVRLSIAGRRRTPGGIILSCTGLAKQAKAM